MAKRSRRWLDEHERDVYVKASREAGYRSRASYKLLEIQEKYGILKPGHRVLDLGAAPGGWSQVAAGIVGESGLVVAVDLLEVSPIEGVTVITGDFTEPETLNDVMSVIGDAPLDLVISDMAPNLSGMKEIDQPRSAYLVELALDMARTVLRPGGALLAKCFEGSGISDLRDGFRGSFGKLNNIKPAASRDRSREIYLLGRGRK
ncbi:MAG: RlmE family RNA methyltransferase [Proteobacteria bacterium]|nr:RlmE family RNA methyltransferase [Pseudomonadota bacterium]MDA1300325.1 RlmE family RNA methyltransferase [Pseudomonadota bacterium]